MLFVVLAAARQTGAVMLCRSLSDDRGWPVRVDAAAPTPPPVLRRDFVPRTHCVIVASRLRTPTSTTG